MEKKKILPIIIPILLLVAIFVVLIIINNKNDNNSNGNTSNTNSNIVSVQDNKNEIRKNDTLANCINNVKEVLNYKYTNLNFTDCKFDSVENINSDKLYTFTTQFPKYDDAYAEILEEKRSVIVDLYKKLYGKDVSDLDYTTDEDGSITCSTEEISYSVNAFNTFSMFDQGRYMFPIAPIVTRKGLYRLGEEEDVDSVKGSKMKITIGEAIEICDEWANGPLKAFSVGDAYMPKVAYIVEGNEGNQAYVIRYQHTFKGIGLNDIGNGATAEYGYLKMNWLEFEIDNSGISGVRSFYGTTFKDSVELEDSFITCKKASDILSGFLAPYGVYNVNSVSITYCAPTYVDASYSPTEFDYRPMWTFLVGEADIQASDIDPRIIMCVDMIDGTIFIIDTINNDVWFSINPNIEL